MSKDASARGRSNRNKGCGGEREVCRFLTDETGIKASRNLKQYQEAQHGDIIFGPFCIEVKNHKRRSVRAWWRQAVESAKRIGKIPALAYKVHGIGFRYVVPHTSAQGEWSHDYEYTIDVGPACFAMIVREAL